MLNFLLDNSVLIVFLITALIIGNSEYKLYLERRNMTHQSFRNQLGDRLKLLRTEILIKSILAVFLTFIISVVSFRQLWINDCFHIVFLTLLLVNPVYKRLKTLIK